MERNCQNPSESISEADKRKKLDNLQKLYALLIEKKKIPPFDLKETNLIASDRLEMLSEVEQNAQRPVCPVFADVGEAWSGDMSPEKPSVAEVMPGKFMLYRGRMNEQHGEPGIGKSNVSLLFAMLEMNAGRDVVYIDPEDTIFGICRRLAALGASREAVVKHLKYINPTTEHFWKLHLWACICRPSLVILDGLSRSMMLDGKDEDRAKEVLEFTSDYVRPFLLSEAAVLVSDHVTKSKESRGRHSRGSGAKLGEWDGVSYEVELINAYTPTQAGGLRLRICKDRNGGVGQINEVALEIHFSPGEDGKTTHRFAHPTSGEFRPTHCMEKVSIFLENNPDAGLKDVRENVTFKHQRIDQALKQLEKEGFLKVHKDGGKRNRYHVLKPYREEQEPEKQPELGDQP
jgi:hypothetical protein